MDGWFVAVAAGAGYLAKHWQLLAKVKEASLDGDDGKPSSKNSEFALLSVKKQVSQNTMPPRGLGSSQWNSVFQRLARRELGDESSSSTGDKASVHVADSTNGIASNSGVGGGIFTNMGGSGEMTVSSSISLLPQSLVEENNQESGHAINGINEFSHLSFHKVEAYQRKLSTQFGCGRFRKSRKARWHCGYASIRPLNSLESCAIAQMYKEHVEMEEYIFSSLETPPCTLAARPFIITDGNRIISKARNDASTLQLEHQAHCSRIEDLVKLREKEVVMEIPPCSKTGLRELRRNSKKQKGKASNGHSNGYDMGLNLEKFPSRGSVDGIYLFCLGIGIGFIFNTLSNRRVVDNLKDLLRQSQNLVQDLQEELEMKDSLTVKELANEACGFQEINDQSTYTKGSTSPFQVQGAFTTNILAEQSVHWTNNDEHRREEDNLESMSKIEAELEAELERLEMNINSSSLEKRLADLGEFDPDLVADVVRGELRADMLNSGTDLNNHDSTTGSSTTNTDPANYVVSPKELSLRLHEVIQSRLEERILELEAALQDSQKRLRFVETEWMNSQKGLSNSDIGSPSTEESPVAVQHGNATTVSPLFLNLSGDALDAYDEAYAEFMKITNTEEKSPVSTDNGIGELRGGAGDQNGMLPRYKISHEDLFHVNESESEESDDHDDEIGKLLIKQIVEKTRQGSPVVLNAQKILFSMDEQLTK